MKLPRDLSGADLIRALGRVGYRVTRQTGSHAGLTIDAPTHRQRLRTSPNGIHGHGSRSRSTA